MLTWDGISFHDLGKAEVDMTQCGFLEYHDSSIRCPNESIDTLEIDIEKSTFKVPMCEFHSETWMIAIGMKGLAALIRDNRLFGKWR